MSDSASCPGCGAMHDKVLALQAEIEQMRKALERCRVLFSRGIDPRLDDALDGVDAALGTSRQKRALCAGEAPSVSDGSPQGARPEGA